MGLAWVALFWGALSAVSLPLGAALGLWLRPPRIVLSALMAFGGGALLFALTIELFGHALHLASGEHGKIVRPGILIVAIVAAVAGGLLFNLLNRLLESKGGFLRKGALLKKYVAREKRREARHQLRGLSRVPLIRTLPVEEVIRLLTNLERVRFGPGETIFSEGEEGDGLYIIEAGEVALERSGNGSADRGELATLRVGDVFGEMALVTRRPRSATVVARATVSAWRLRREDFERDRASSTELGGALEDLALARIRDLGEQRSLSVEEAESWAREAGAALNRLAVPAPLAHGDGYGPRNAALAIWLGIALDGIPESLVIGMLVVSAAAAGTSLSLAFIVGVFLANLPEAMSSAVVMRRGGMRIPRILAMWGSLFALTAVGAFAGALLLPPSTAGSLSYAVFAMEGLAGGAMLTMIAETMLPEAFEQGGGPVVGLSTLLGFLTALAVKLLH
ncbi:MAG TPA: cyclic nucleotide-binding domain-containing protein [Polyangia bacterium]|nr:cyclic nucleotide-binding domain-containing protein [Polyangia bacterium]